MTEAQEKSHTEFIDLYSRTPISQLMWRAVMYKHQAGADGSTSPRPTKKNTLLIFGSPLDASFHCTHMCTL